MLIDAHNLTPLDHGDSVDETIHVFRSPKIVRITSAWAPLKDAGICGILAGGLAWLMLSLGINPGAPLPDWARGVAVLVGFLSAEVVWIALARLHPSRLIVDGSRLWFGRWQLGTWYEANAIRLVDVDVHDGLFAPNLRCVAVTLDGNRKREIVLHPDDAEVVVLLLRARSRRVGVATAGRLVELPDDDDHAAEAQLILDRRHRRERITVLLLGTFLTAGSIIFFIEALNTPVAPRGRIWRLVGWAIGVLVGLTLFAAAVFVRHPGGEMDGESDGFDE